MTGWLHWALQKTKQKRTMADMRDLNVLPADVYPYATREVPEMIEMIAKLIQKGYAYEAASIALQFANAYNTLAMMLE